MPAAIPVVAGEAVLAAEVLAAEAAAAAAAEAASVAAAEAAAVAAAEQAAAAAATEAATTAAATEAATAAGTSGLEALNLAQTQTLSPLSNQLPGQLTAEQISAYTSGIPQAGQGVQVAQAGTSGGLDALAQAQAGTGASSYTGAPSSFTGTPAYATPTPVAPTAPPPAPSTMLDYGMTRPAEMGGASGMTAPLDTTVPSEFGLSNQYGNYGLAKDVVSPASVQTATGQPGFFDKALNYIKDNKIASASMGLNALKAFNKKGPQEKEKYSGPLSRYEFDPDVYQPYEPEPPTPYQPKMYYAGGGPVEMMSNANIGVNPMMGEMAFAGGGISSLGEYSDYARGGRMLKGPGDGMSDNIPATIAGKQPARLANEEFVVPADVVSHLGNGSSEAGAKALYKMMDRVRQARTGNKKQGKQINPEKYLA
jgi:hypothetical protein